MNHFKTLTMVSMGTKVTSRDSFLDKLSENFTWMDSKKGSRVFAGGGGGGHNVPPLGFWSTKKKAWLG